MNDNFYTLSLWKIKGGNRDEFLYVWKNEFVSEYLRYNPYSSATLIQSLENPNVYYSFSPWANLATLQSARSDKKVRTVISKLVELCIEAKPGSFKKIETISGDK
ncbi:MAG: hypothetical protein ACM339_09090 [Ignavibacteria bacterium]